MKLTSCARPSIAVALSILLLPFAPIGAYGQDPGAYAPLDASQLDQLVAPIALYPDALVAQVLTASTFSDQVSNADNWIHQNEGMPPDQMGAAVDTMPWDPSVKALVEFPTVLDNMARNNGWTAALGNAYYNQPGDVMNAVQAMRFQAQQAGTLRGTAQERVYANGGLIVIEPVNPGMVYVPYYNPWVVYGAPVPAWSGYYWGGPPAGVAFGGGLAIGFGVGIGVGLFSHFGWGYNAWSPNWRGGVVVYNHNTYISRSTTVVNHGNFGVNNRGVFEHAGKGVPGGYHPAVTAQSAAFAHPATGGNHPAGAPAQAYRPAPGSSYHPAPAANQPYRPAPGSTNRPTPAASQPYRPAPGSTYHPAPATAPRAAPSSAPHQSTPAYHPPAAAPHAAPSSRPAPHAAAPAPHAAAPAHASNPKPAAHSNPKPEKHEK